MSRKLALVIGNSEYDDLNLARLVTPGADVESLTQILGDSNIGGFDEVTMLVNESATTIRRAIARFFAGKSREDLLLMYFSGHGMLDDRGHLYLAVKDTERAFLNATAIPAGFVADEMDQSYSRRQVLILDCCHSGAFARGAKGSVGASVGTAVAFGGSGSGRVVLTATDSTQYAWEGEQVLGQGEHSVFTHYLIQALRTGDADTNADGLITLDELYNYVYEHVLHETPKQTPGKWSYRQQGDIVIARTEQRVVRPTELPIELRQAIEHPLTSVREGVVKELSLLLYGSHPGLAIAAQQALQQLMSDDSRRVSMSATEILERYATLQQAQIGSPIEQPQTNKPIIVEVPSSQQSPIQSAKFEKSELKTQGLKAKVEHATVPSNTVHATGTIPWTPVVFTGIGWSLGWILSLFTALVTESNWGWIFGWIAAGVVTGAALRRKEPLLEWHYVLLLIVGWPVVMAIGLFYDLVASLALSVIITGMITGFVLWRVKSLTKRWHIPLVAISLGIGWYLSGSTFEDNIWLNVDFLDETDLHDMLSDYPLLFFYLVRSGISGAVISAGVVPWLLSRSVTSTYLLRLALLTTAGWVGGWIIGLIITRLTLSSLGWIGGWFIVSLITGAIVRWKSILTGWKKQLLYAIGWPLCLSIGLLIGIYSSYDSTGVVVWIMSIITAGVVIALLLKEVEPRITVKHILIYSISWSAAWLFGGYNMWQYLLDELYKSTSFREDWWEYMSITSSVSFVYGAILCGLISNLVTFSFFKQFERDVESL